ncbi:glutaminyl-peptide cyclotransferase [Caulobacter sp. UNC279MFTsu5.1]|uniref:glutaminyl-peptide cyclotransferase n=1 Tax=Caulobacter sp. UNC279MFTsu5.1 TaxID=1502775 RepID=UPI0008E7A675|nr:glutaminyl-peptide cyclotransferase [Caulobacter sp. UNC279MFTsu5.1]SFJ58177.1 Glutamine cyclotransferase [Caulobacter sp. UNC279MFTsu5.1]
MMRRTVLIALVSLLAACAPRGHAATPVYGYQVVRTYPHDPNAFTEGLFLRDGFLYESTGLEGASSIRKTVLETGSVENERSISSQFFGEGIIDWKDRLIQLTWKTQVGFVYGIDDFETKGEFSYPGEGWALTRDDKRIIMSDGTPRLRFLDPETLKETGGITVTDEGKPVDQLNELEWVKGEIYANIWQTDRIARIDPATGKVKSWIDLTGLLPVEDRARADVLNGIAYDAKADRLIVTGKLWPRLYEIRLVPKPH